MVSQVYNLFLIFLIITQASISLFAAPAGNDYWDELNSVNDFKGVRGLRDCDSDDGNFLGKFTSVYIYGCDQTPCTLARQGNITILFETVYNGNHKNLDILVEFKTSLGIKAVFQRIKACKYLTEGGECSFQMGEKYTSGFSIPTPPVLKTAAYGFITFNFQNPYDESEQLCVGVDVTYV